MGRVFLVIFNLLFVLVGLALVVVGALLKGGADFLDLLGDFVKQIPGLDQLAGALIGLGCAIFIIGILGTCGSCCNVKCMLVLYAIIVIIITLTECILVALLFTGKLDNTIRDGLSSLTSKYKVPPDLTNIDSTDIISRLIDKLYIELQCCDYKNNTVDDIPPTCCKGVTRETLDGGDISSLANCVSSPDTLNSNIGQDCIDAIMDLIKQNQSYVIGVGVGVLVVELLCIVFSFWICHQISKQNKVNPI